jgi:hypothetical protein
MRDAGDMASHSNDSTAPRHGSLANVIPFPTSRIADDNTPPSSCRDPRRFPYGLLIVERRMAGGANGFHWFSNEAEAAQFLRCGLWPFIGDDEAAAQVRSLYVDALRSTSRIEDDWLLEVSEQQDDVLVVWRGLFDTLLTGSDGFAKGVVSDFLLVQAGSGGAVTDVGTFIRYLDVFRGEISSGL